MTMTRREILQAMAAGMAASLAVPRAQAQPNGRKPNILFILADDLGYGDLGCYGQEKILTPCLDRMAAEGMRFTQAYAGCTVCAPSRCALMTGMHMGHAYIRGNGSLIGRERLALRPGDVTVAEVLKQAGYATALIGKWGLGDTDTTGAPNRKGFDTFFGYTDQTLAHNYYPETLWRNDQEEVIPGNELEMPNVCKRCETYSHDLFTREALEFLGRQHEAPFFLYLAYTIPHANNEAGRVRENGMEVPSDEPYSDKPWPQAQRNHAAMISRMDRDVGRILDLLKEKGMAENTLVIFSSDNGVHKEGGVMPDFFQDSGPLRGIKRDLYEGGIRVPAIAWWPGMIEAGKVSDHPWAFWDFLPTAAELAGVEAPPSDGISLVPSLKGAGEQRPHQYLYWEFHEGGFKQAVRFDDWKAVKNGKNKEMELYRLDQDLGETTNCAGQYPDKVEQAAAFLKDARTESEHFPIR